MGILFTPFRIAEGVRAVLYQILDDEDFAIECEAGALSYSYSLEPSDRMLVLADLDSPADVRVRWVRINRRALHPLVYGPWGEFTAYGRDWLVATRRLTMYENEQAKDSSEKTLRMLASVSGVNEATVYGSHRTHLNIYSGSVNVSVKTDLPDSEMLDRLLRAFRDQDGVSELSVYRTNRPPSLSLKCYESLITVALNDDSGVKATDLLCERLKHSPHRMREFINSIKHWTNSNVRRALLPGYATTWLAIFFLLDIYGIDLLNYEGEQETASRQRELCQSLEHIVPVWVAYLRTRLRFALLCKRVEVSFRAGKWLPSAAEGNFELVMADPSSGANLLAHLTQMDVEALICVCERDSWV